MVELSLGFAALTNFQSKATLGLRVASTKLTTMTTPMISFDAAHIIQWASLPDACYRLPELIRRLVMSDADSLQISEIRMPSGSSVRLPGLDGWLITANSNPWVPQGQSAWEFSCDTSIIHKASEDYNKRTNSQQTFDIAETTFVFVTARRSPTKISWANQLNREGRWRTVRMLDADDLVVWLEQAPGVANWFATINTTAQFISPTPLSQIALSQHNQETVLQITAATDASIEKLKSHIDIKFAAVPQQADSPETANPDMLNITREIDQAGDLLSLGLTKTAYNKLTTLYDEITIYPPDVAFRIATNLAMCCLANQELERACIFFDTAYKYQPTNVAAIANAALAAQLRNDAPSAMNFAHEAREISPHDSQATSVLIEGFWQTGASDDIESLIHNEPWIFDDERCTLALAGVREKQGRFENATELYRTLISFDPAEAVPYLALSLCLLNGARANRHLGLTKEQLAPIQEADTIATKALEILVDTQLHAHRDVAAVVRGIARSLLERTEHALSDFDSVTDESPAQSEAAFHKLLLLLHLGRLQDAQETLEQISDLDRRRESLQVLTSQLINAARPLEATTLLQGEYTLVQPTWDDISIGELLITAERSAGTTDTVGPKITDALRLDSVNPLVLTLSGIHAHLHGDIDRATAILHKAIDQAISTCSVSAMV